MVKMENGYSHACAVRQSFVASYEHLKRAILKEDRCLEKYTVDNTQQESNKNEEEKYSLSQM